MASYTGINCTNLQCGQAVYDMRTGPPDWLIVFGDRFDSVSEFGFEVLDGQQVIESALLAKRAYAPEQVTTTDYTHGTLVYLDGRKNRKGEVMLLGYALKHGMYVTFFEIQLNGKSVEEGRNKYQGRKTKPRILEIKEAN